MSTTYTLGSWVVILAVAGLIFYFNYYKPAQGRQATLSKLAAKTTEKKKEPKKLRKGFKDEGQSSLVQEKTQKVKPKAESTTVANDVNQYEEELDNKEFARQLSSTKAGTLIPSKSQDGARQRSVKQTRAQEKPAVVETSSDNGTAGADADDDRSSLNSPELGATSMASVANGDVSDMLEAPAPGPFVLRLTSPTSPIVPKKAKPAAIYEVAETKKQRQNRKKVELKKQAREEEEKERKVLLEKQRRTAREAEGRAAKDGSAFMAAKAPSTSAWTPPVTTEITKDNGQKTIDAAAKVDYLDTYTPKAPASQETTQSESELTGSDWQKVAESISEEEQVRRALEDSDSWKTVSKDKRNKKKIQSKPTKLESNDEGDVSDYAPPRLVEPSQPGQKWNMTLVNKHPDGYYEEYSKEVQDSEWEVA